MRFLLAGRWILRIYENGTMRISCKLNKNVVLAGKQGVDELHLTSYYGRPNGESLQLSLTESAYLIYMGKITVESEGNKLDFKENILFFFCIISLPWHNEGLLQN